MYENIFTLENTITINYFVWILLALLLNYQNGPETLAQLGSELWLNELAHPDAVTVCKFYWNEEIQVWGLVWLCSPWAFGAVTYFTSVALHFLMHKLGELGWLTSKICQVF